MTREQAIKEMKEYGITLLYGISRMSPISYTNINKNEPFYNLKHGEIMKWKDFEFNTPITFEEWHVQ